MHNKSGTKANTERTKVQKQGDKSANTGGQKGQ